MICDKCKQMAKSLNVRSRANAYLSDIELCDKCNKEFEEPKIKETKDILDECVALCNLTLKLKELKK